jgi:hypothetical protein
MEKSLYQESQRNNYGVPQRNNNYIQSIYAGSGCIAGHCENTNHKKNNSAMFLQRSLAHWITKRLTPRESPPIRVTIPHAVAKIFLLIEHKVNINFYRESHHYFTDFSQWKNSFFRKYMHQRWCLRRGTFQKGQRTGHHNLVRNNDAARRCFPKRTTDGATLKFYSDKVIFNTKKFSLH